MFNCYVLYWAGRQFAVVKTWQCAENMALKLGMVNYHVEGKYIESIGF